MDRRATPTVLRLSTGKKLRELRRSAGVTPAQAAGRLGCHASKISRLETGEIENLQVDEIENLLTLYGLDGGDPVRCGLLQDVRDAQVPQWWHAYRGLLSPAEQRYVALESDACEVRAWANYTIPEILQTGAYAAALALGGRGETKQRQSFRLAWQALVREPGRRMWFILDESALRRGVGNAGVMREQGRQLIRVAKEPGVTIQVARVSAGAYPGADIPFALLRFEDPGMQDIACTRVRGGSLYTAKTAEVDGCRLVADLLAAAAEPPEATPDIVADIC